MKPIAGLEDFFPPERLALLQDGRETEISQMLSYLGYLGEASSTATLDFRPAFEHFRIDAFAEDLFQQFLFSFDDVPLQSGLAFPINPIEHKALTEMTSLEGDFISNSAPEIGSVTLTSRIIRYRLKLLGLSQQHPATPFNMEAIEGLNTIRKWFAASSILDAINLSGNIPGMIRYITDHLSDRVVYFKIDEEPHRSIHLDNPAVKAEFTRELKNSLPKKSEAFRFFRKHVLSEELPVINDQVNDPFNSFLFRILQVHQWMAGFYHGDIGEREAKLTFASLLEYLKVEVESGNVEMKIWHTTAYVGSGLWVFNIMYYFRSVRKLYDNSITMEDVLEEFKQRTASPAMEATSFSSNATISGMDAKWKEANHTSANPLEFNLVKPIERFYYGAKTIVKRIGGVIKKVFDWFRDRAVELSTWLKSVVKVIYRELREGIRVFAHGMKYLFGSREIQTGQAGSSLLLTKFDLDTDAVLFASGKLTDADIASHKESSTYFGSSLMFSLTLTGRVIHWAIGLVTGGAWAEVLVKIAQIFHEMVKTWLKKKKARKGEISISF